MNETIMPTGLTFLTGFAFVIVANIDGLTMQSFQYGAIFVVLLPQLA